MHFAGFLCIAKTMFFDVFNAGFVFTTLASFATTIFIACAGFFFTRCFVVRFFTFDLVNGASACQPGVASRSPGTVSISITDGHAS